MHEVLALVLAVVTATLPPPQHLPTISVKTLHATLTLQVARTDREREIGLMNVTSLPDHTGMIFVFPQDGPVTFWMKDTLIPLDMVFVAKDGTVRDIDVRVPTVPLTMPNENIPMEQGNAKFVIELASGEAEAAGIFVGTKLALPIR